MRMRIGAVAEGFIELPFTGHLALGAYGRAIRLRRRNKGQREAALIVVNMSREDDVHVVGFKQRRKQTHILFGKMLLGGVETGLVERNETPRRGLRRGQI